MYVLQPPDSVHVRVPSIRGRTCTSYNCLIAYIYMYVVNTWPLEFMQIIMNNITAAKANCGASKTFMYAYLETLQMKQQEKSREHCCVCDVVVQDSVIQWYNPLRASILKTFNIQCFKGLFRALVTYPIFPILLNRILYLGTFLMSTDTEYFH